MNDEWPCPIDLVDGEKIEIFDPNGGFYSAKVVDTINGIASVSLDDFMNTVVSIDSRHTQWRRTKPKVTYGVRCSDRFCNEWFPHAEAVPNFKCWQCARR